jgi:isopenicillin N synthase-like dioxygenase
MRWCNGRWRNIIHRVVEPALLRQGVVLDDADDSKDTEKDTGALDRISPTRYSIPFSAAFDQETIVQALPGWSEEVPKRWKRIPITSTDIFSSP